MPGFVTTGEPALNATGSQWVAVRSLDGLRFALKVLAVTDAAQAQEVATRQMAEFDRIGNEHLVRRHGAVATSEGTLALVLDEVTGGSLAQLIGARGQLTPGETVTTLAPLFRALADLHAERVVHGDLAPGNVLFSADGRPMIGDLGVARLVGGQAGRGDGTSGFEAPELIGGASATAACDVYAMGALGWFCLTGAPPAPAARRPALTTLRPQTPPGLVEALTACLATDPGARPSAGAAAVDVFDAAPAESVALAPVSDPAAEITRRIRAAALSAGDPASRSTGRRYRSPRVVGVVALLVAVTCAAGATWFLQRPPVDSRPLRSASLPVPVPAPVNAPTAAPATSATATLVVAARPHKVAPGRRPASSNEVVTGSRSPRVAAARLLQALVDARALAYVARSPALLDLVYAPGAASAVVDRDNIATALKNGGTYLGLSYVIKDAAFLDGTSGSARIRATILTPAYLTGQPDGRRIPHAQEILGPCTFSLGLTTDGWRVLGLTVP